jgi:hypothetical protein
VTFTPVSLPLPLQPGESAYSTDDARIVVAGRPGEWTAVWWSPLRSPYPARYGHGRSRAGAVRDLTGERL